MNIVITGASKGIGYALAKVFAVDSSNKILAIARSKDELDKLSLMYNNIITIVSDITIDDTLTDKIEKHITHVDVLINNAGHLINKPFLKTTKEDWLMQLNINTIAPALLIQSLYHLMGKDSHTHIINIGSMGGFQGSAKFPGLGAYSASKAAIANLTECLAEEFKENNISVNCLALGAVQTEMLKNAFPDYNANLTADKLALFIVDFAKNGHSFFNGKVLPVSISTP